MMSENVENQPPEPKSPQDELEELLRQARQRSGKKKTGLPTVKLPGNLSGVKNLKINWLAIGLAAFGVIMMIATVLFIVSSLNVNTGTLVLESDQNGVQLKVDEKLVGTVNAGHTQKLKVGEHKLQLTKEGFLDVERTIAITKGATQTLEIAFLPIPTVERAIERSFKWIRLNRDGSEISYFDPADQVFKTFSLTTRVTADLFRGAFDNVVDVIWAPAKQIAMVQLSGTEELPNMADNREAPGRYIELGDRPPQGPPKNNGISTWLFDDNRKIAAGGWQPIRLNESIRQLAYSADGSSILYLYDTLDGEYSLVRAQPEGFDWERIIVDMPRFQNPKLTWAEDDRYVFIEDEGRLWAVDLITKAVGDAFADRIPGSPFALSPDGDQLAYVTSTNIRIYDFFTNEIRPIPNFTPRAGTQFVWLDSATILFAGEGQTFAKVDVDTGKTSTIPFVGISDTSPIKKLDYSRVGQTLLLMTEAGVYVMKI